MSDIIWKKMNIPTDEVMVEDLSDDVFKSVVPRVKKIPGAIQSFKIPDPKALRSMSRASVFLSHLCMDIKPILDPYLTENPFSVGIYCAVENGPIDGPSTQKILSLEGNFVDLYRKNRNPKMYLKQLPNLVPAQLGISLDIRGTMTVYTHSTYGSLQAIEQAEDDLWNDRVKFALVCSAHAFDDFLVVTRTRKFNDKVLAEGVGAMLLKKNGTKIDWKTKIKSDPELYYGISDQIINFIK